VLALVSFYLMQDHVHNWNLRNV